MSRVLVAVACLALAGLLVAGMAAQPPDRPPPCVTAVCR